MVGLVGLVAGLALPFAPVLAQRAEVSWPAPGKPAVSSTAILVPYRPAELSADVPCPALRAAAERGRPTTVLATGGSTDADAGLLVRVADGQASVLVNSRLVGQAAAAGETCAVHVTADRDGVQVTQDGRVRDLPGEPVPEVAFFRTDLDPVAATGLTARARTVNPFDTVPTGLKTALIVVQVLAALGALLLLLRGSWRGFRFGRFRPTSVDGWVDGGVDIGVVAVLAGWAVIGPLSDDDGFVTMIARNSLASGDIGNYYRWWSASESPFTLAQQVVAALSQVSLQPLWLRMPSTLMGVAAWLVLGRAVLPGLVGARARVLAAICFLVAWLPYNLGVRPEPYVALGGVLVLALLWRGRGPAALGLATLAAAVTVTASPSGLLAVAAVPVFADRILRMLRAGDAGRSVVVARLALLGAVGAVGMSLVFADQSLHGLITATRWHAEFSPSLPWYLEVQRYRYLLGEYQDGNALKRVPVLLSLALLPVVALLLARRAGRERDELERAAGRLAGCVAVGFALLWLTPSKWTLYFGSLAGVFAAFLVVSTVLLARQARGETGHTRLALLGGGLVVLAAGLSFAGSNDWWQPVLYAMPWAAGPIRPAGLPLDLPPLWAGAALTVAGGLWLARGRDAGRRALLAAPAALTAAVAVTALAVLLGSFLTAPLRRPEASLALANLREIGGSGCGLADSIEVLPDVPGGILTPAGPEPDQLAGFAAGTGWRSDRPPPDPVGVRASAQVWGSRLDDDPAGTGRLTSRWFTLPTLAADQELALTVSGRTDQGNQLTLEFGRSHGGSPAEQAPSRSGERGSRPAETEATPEIVAERTPDDQPRIGAGQITMPDPSVWRSVAVAPDEIPAGADRVRVIAVDGSSTPGRLARPDRTATAPGRPARRLPADERAGAGQLADRVPLPVRAGRRDGRARDRRSPSRGAGPSGPLQRPGRAEHRPGGRRGVRGGEPDGRARRGAQPGRRTPGSGLGQPAAGRLPRRHPGRVPGRTEPGPTVRTFG